MARTKSIVAESRDIGRALDLIRLGARLQVLESETSLSRERLLRLYKEVQGESPPKGMLPFSTDWFMTWQPNVHASLFLNIFRFLDKTTELDEIDAIIKAYGLYLEQISSQGMDRVLSITRAWRLIKFCDAGMLTTVPCTRCAGRFVAHTLGLNDGFVCGLCHMPSRAGKTRAAAAKYAALAGLSGSSPAAQVA